jgi:hypothetical protein
MDLRSDPTSARRITLDVLARLAAVHHDRKSTPNLSNLQTASNLWQIAAENGQQKLAGCANHINGPTMFSEFARIRERDARTRPRVVVLKYH